MFKASDRTVIINWGNSGNSVHALRISKEAGKFYNTFDAVKLSGDKLKSLTKLKESGVDTPEFTTDKNTATNWAGKGGVVVCRTTLNGHSGAGIVLAKSVDEVVNAPLYTLYTKKRKEFRVHVAFGNVIDVQEKRRRQEYEGERNQYVRSYHTGWVFCREDIQEPKGLREIAIRSVNVLGLDFGAVDIIWNEHQDRCFVLEVNTAPGLEGATIDSYVEAFSKEINTND